MKILPILFSTEMVRAILDGKKTQTRRTKGLESKNEFPDAWSRKGNPLQTINRFWDSTKENNPNPLSLSFGFRVRGYPNETITYMKSNVKPGDIFWVRETFYKTSAPELNGAYYYKASIEEGWNFKWKPSIFMPKDACRIFLEVTDVRVERLQDISEEDAIAEGVLFDKDFDSYNCYLCNKKGHKAGNEICEDGFFDNAHESFRSLWKSINGEESWNHNPWVWVYEFKRVEKPKNFT